MAERTLTSKLIPKTYAELRTAVLAVVHRGRQEIDRAWLNSFHETGRLIHVHLLFKQERAAYGAKVFADLAADSGTSSRSLHEFVLFYRYYPIVRAPAQLSWNHYRILCQVADRTRRDALLAETLKRGWSSPDLERRVRALALPKPDASEAAKNVTPEKLLVSQRGTPGLHLIIDRGDGLAVDLGFKLYWPLAPEQAKRFARADIVRIASDNSLRRAEDATKADLFTYAARLRRVIDGDTLVVALEVSPGVFIDQKLRLRGLDCPEMKTPEGKAAKRFVDALVFRTTAITINTTKPDKYDRYLADVFLTTDAGEVYLNNALLENGHAVRKEAWQFGDWEPAWVG
jgi:micrococcal nuclease